jgi:hypothetical protein
MTLILVFVSPGDASSIFADGFWADCGFWHRTNVLPGLTAFFSDQPEADTYSCDNAQSCKRCHCPSLRDSLHAPENRDDADIPPSQVEGTDHQHWHADIEDSDDDV